ncbi:Retrovirus-related Pol polyprotein from transposon TNT 1-94, partial [Linum grandiflorum]
QRFCRSRKKEQGKRPDSHKDGDDRNTAATTSKSDDGVTLICVSGECHHVESLDTEWPVDSAASYHCVPKRDYFLNYQTGDFGRVKMGNQSTAEIVGIGDIRVKTSVGCMLTLKNVRHIPDLRLNLLAANVLDQEGFRHTFGDGKWKLSKGSLTVARGELCCTLYKTYFDVCYGEVNAVEEKNSPNLWHRRLGHMSDKGIKLLAGKSLIPVDKSVSLDPCDHCLAGKQHRASFSGKSTRKHDKLELVHSDVCGPVEMESLGGNRYFVTFIDDATRKTWVYMMKAKSQVFEIFRNFHVMVERETGSKLKCLRSDNGGTPQHNGVAEKMNRTIVEKVRCMLRMSDLPKTFWAEAVQCAVYLINRSPSIPLGLDIPYRAWKGRDPTYSHLRVFGSKAYMHVPKEQRSKLDSKTVPCIFVGYADEEYGFRLYDPEKKKVVRSRDVVFFEHEKGADLLSMRYISTSELPIDSANVPSSTVQPSNENVEDVVDDVDEVQPESDAPTVDDNDLDESSDEEIQEENGLGEDNHEEVHEQGEQPIPQVEDTHVRRSTRDRKPSTKYPSSEFILITEDGEPANYQEVLSHSEKDQWFDAMKEEMSSLKKNETYELVKLPKGKKVLKNRWIFKNKKDGEKIVRRKARLVVKGCNQKKGIDFDEIFSPVVKMTSIRTVLGFAASLDLELEQLDVKTAFLHGNLHEEIYMEQPEGFEEKGKSELVCKLKKSLYGLKQAPRQWYRKFDSFMTRNGYKRTTADPCVYFRKFTGGNFIILLLYVDDMLIVGQDAAMIQSLKKDLSKSFDMKDLGPAKQILGMEIARDRKAGKLWLSQEKYIERVLDRFNMKNAKSVSTPLASHFKLSKKACPATE